MKAPRLLQSLFSAVGDLYLYKFSRVLFGDHVAKWAVSFCYEFLLDYSNIINRFYCYFSTSYQKLSFLFIEMQGTVIFIMTLMIVDVLNCTAVVFSIGKLVHVFLFQSYIFK